MSYLRYSSPGPEKKKKSNLQTQRIYRYRTGSLYCGGSGPVFRRRVPRKPQIFFLRDIIRVFSKINYKISTVDGFPFIVFGPDHAEHNRDDEYGLLVNHAGKPPNRL